MNCVFHMVWDIEVSDILVIRTHYFNHEVGGSSHLGNRVKTASFLGRGFRAWVFNDLSLLSQLLYLLFLLCCAFYRLMLNFVFLLSWISFFSLSQYLQKNFSHNGDHYLGRHWSSKKWYVHSLCWTLAIYLHMEICSYVCITKHITIHERIPRFPSQTYVRTYLTYGLELIFYFDQVRGVRPLPLLEMANLFNSLRLVVCPGLVSFWSFVYFGLFPSRFFTFTLTLCCNSWFLMQDPNTNNLIASTTFYSESTRAMLCLVS